MGRKATSNHKFFNENRVKRPGYIPLNDRDATEWDLRIDLNDNLTATAVVDSVRSHKDSLIYCLVSGLEYGKSRNDRPSSKGWIQEEESLHVHIAVITAKPMKRLDVLALFRPKKVSGEYAVPRKTEHTYAGWRMHHCKDDTKIESAEPIWEYGTLPLDPLNEETGLKIYYMVRMYGTPTDKIKWKEWIDLGLKKKARMAADKKRKAADEVEELRKRLKIAEDKLAQQ